MKKVLTLAVLCLMMFACKNSSEKDKNTIKDTRIEDQDKTQENIASEIKITPISHATMVLQLDEETLYIDPVGGAEAFKQQPDPTILMVTDIHGDHFNIETLAKLSSEKTTLIMPQAVASKLPDTIKGKKIVLNNQETQTITAITVEAIPMYNLRPEALKFHKKGRGNGYVITYNGKRIYISGDTEDIPEMRQLKNIDMAFVCMNLPYTMPVDSAIDAVLEFKPKKVYPYHYRGKDGFSDVDKFTSTVTHKSDGAIEVINLDWYPAKKS